VKQEILRLPLQLRRAFGEWNQVEAPRLGASLAFYTLLSLAPLLLVVVGVAGLVFDRTAAQRQLVEQFQEVVGGKSAEAIEIILQETHKPASGLLASVVGFCILLVAASGVLIELREALNRIWHVPVKPRSNFVGFLKNQLLNFGMVLAVGFMLLVSLVVSAGIAAADKFARSTIDAPMHWFLVANFVISLFVTTIMFTLIFRWIPDARIGWRSLLPGAFVTALFFTIGKHLISLYLGKTSVGSAYGAAGSLVVLIAWVYYSAQVFFFGAAFTHVTTEITGENADGNR